MAARVLVIENDPIAPLDLVEEWLVESGLEVDIVKPHLGQHMPNSIPAGYQGLLVLGGTMGAHDDEEFSWLTPQRSLMKDAIATDFPFVGICLGAQMLATAVDGKSVRTPSPEAGVERIKFNSDAANDKLFAPLANQEVPAVAWHQDYIVDLPKDAVILGSSDSCPVHAFRIGQNVYGMQFHPEVSSATVSSWAKPNNDVLKKLGKSAHSALAEVVESQEELIKTWKPVFTRFAKTVIENQV